MELNADLIIPLVAAAGAAVLAIRALRGRPVPVVMVVDRDGKVHELPADDPRISSRL